MWDFMFEWALPIIIVIFLLVMIFGLGAVMFFGIRDSVNNSAHVHNLETKLNIYEQEYNNYVLEDSLKQ